MHLNDKSNNGETVRRTQSTEEAPFTVDDLQSELSCNPNFSEMIKASVPLDSEPAANASGVKAEAVRSPMHDAPQAAETSSAAAATAAHSSDTPAPAISTEGADGRNGVLESLPAVLAEQPPSPSATSSAGTTTEHPDAPLQAADTQPKPPVTLQPPPEQGALPQAHPPSSTEAGPDQTRQEDPVTAGPSDAGAAPSTSPTHSYEELDAPQAGLNGMPESEVSAAVAPAADSAAHSPPSRDASLNTEELDMHVPEQQGDTSRASDAVPADTAHADAAAPSVRTEAKTNLGLEESPVKAQGQSEADDTADVAEGQQPSTDETVAPWETQASDFGWADGGFAEAPASMDVQPPDGGDLNGAPASVSTELPTDGSTGQHFLVLPKEAHADDSHWADDAFAAAPAWPNAEQTTSQAPSTDAQAAVAGTGDTEDSVAQAAVDSSDETSGKLLPTDAELPSTPAASGVVDTAAAGVVDTAVAGEPDTAAAGKCDTAAAGEADTAGGTNGSEQPGKGEAEGDEWGDDDDFGDFNDAGSDGDDAGFGAFNEAEAVTPTSADASVQSPETTPRATQPSSVPPGIRKQDYINLDPSPPRPPTHTYTYPQAAPMHALSHAVPAMDVRSSTSTQHIHVKHASTSKLLLQSSLALSVLIPLFCWPQSRTIGPCRLCTQFHLPLMCSLLAPFELSLM